MHVNKQINNHQVRNRRSRKKNLKWFFAATHCIRDWKRTNWDWEKRAECTSFPSSQMKRITKRTHTRGHIHKSTFLRDFAKLAEHYSCHRPHICTVYIHRLHRKWKCAHSDGSHVKLERECSGAHCLHQDLVSLFSLWKLEHVPP